MFKRGQLTLFVIIGVVIVFGIVGYYFLGSSKGEVSSEDFESSEAGMLKNELVDCFRGSFDYSIGFVSAQGGYALMPKSPVYDGGDFFIPYYFKGSNYLPSLSDIEGELGRISSDLVLECVKESETYSSYDWDYDIVNVRVSINDGVVVFENDLSISFKRGDLNFLIDFSSEPIIIESKLYSMYGLASFIVSDIKEHGDLCMNCIGDLTEESDLYLEALTYFEDENLLFMIIDEDTNTGPLIFQFLVWEDIK
jgi:hypothetical protein